MLYGGRNVRFIRSAPCITAKSSIKESGLRKQPAFCIAEATIGYSLELL